MKRAGRRPIQARAAERNRRVQFNMHIGQEEAPAQRDLVDGFFGNGPHRESSLSEPVIAEPVLRTRMVY